MARKTYVIQHAGQYEGTLASVGQPVRRHRYDSVDAAVDTAARIARIRDVAVVEVDGDEGLEYYVYPSEAAAEDDADGSRAWFIVGRPSRFGEDD